MIKTWKYSWSLRFKNRPLLYHRGFKWEDKTIFVRRGSDGWWSVEMSRADDEATERVRPYGFGETQKEAFNDFRNELKKEIK